MAKHTHGTVKANGTATLMERITGNGGAAIVREDISAASYSVFAIDPDDESTRTAVAGHDSVGLTVADVIFEALVADDVRWTRDDTGYNFRHTVDISSNQAFPTPHRVYIVEYRLTPDEGQVIVVTFRLRTI